MKKVNLILVSILVISLSSCVTHYFAEPVPVDAKDYSSIPQSIQGRWTAKGDVHTISEDKWISEKTDSLGNKTTKIEYELSDSLIVRTADGYYFFNNLHSNGYWTVSLGYKQSNHFFIKGLGDSDTLTLVNSVGLTPDSINDASDRYFNTPFTNKLMKKFIEDGGFADTLIVFDIDNRTIKDLY
ncbi:MAG: hypothetical protein RBR40_14450 [Tenuifilaceae bacterium]|nr:hypothetical protein [Tenuifilaceae bacterium]